MFAINEDPRTPLTSDYIRFLFCPVLGPTLRGLRLADVFRFLVLVWGPACSSSEEERTASVQG